MLEQVNNQGKQKQSNAQAPLVKEDLRVIDGVPFITGAIFDCDGTLLDSLDAWRGIEGVLAHEAGVEVSTEERALFTTFTIPEVATYFHEVYSLGKNVSAVQDLINEYMMNYYHNEATLLPGVRVFLESCARANVAMSVASSSASAYLEAGLTGTGIREYFSAVVSVDDVGASKREPRIFNYSRELIGTPKATTWGFEDSVYAMNTLHAAGYPVLGLYDEGEKITFTELQSIADLSIRSFDEVRISPDGLFVSLL